MREIKIDSTKDYEKVLKDLRNEFFEDYSFEKAYKEANNFVSDFNFFKEFIERTKKSDIKIGLTPEDKLLSAMYKNLIVKNNADEIVRLLVAYNVFKRLIKKVYDSVWSDKDSDYLIKKYLLLEEVAYWFYSIDLREFVPMYIGCSSGINSVLAEINKLKIKQDLH